MASTDTGDSHYFDNAPSAASKRQEIELVLPDVYLSLTTDSGVFSASQVDKGTRYLLQAMPTVESLPNTPTNIVDLGCGYGPIGLAMARRAPNAKVWGVDVNERAIGLANENAAANNVTNASFHLVDDLDPALRFDLIVSNPPIRIGKAALHELLATWLSRLTPQGRAWLVVQKHLGSDSLASWMTDQGWNTTRLGSRKGFRILEVLAHQENS